MGLINFPENDIYTEDILSPFRNPGVEGSDEKGMSTIGNQTNLKEGHYVFHFSINPKNTEEFYAKINDGKNENEKSFLSDSDIDNLKEAFNNSVTALDSSRKMGTENEATIWMQLNKDSKKMLPGLTELIVIKRLNGKVEIDCKNVKTNLDSINSEVEKVEVYYNPSNTNIVGLDKNDKIKHFNILNNQELKMNDRLISVDLFSSFGFLKKPDINVDIYLTYNCLHKTRPTWNLGCYNRLKRLPSGV